MFQALDQREMMRDLEDFGESGSAATVDLDLGSSDGLGLWTFGGSEIWAFEARGLRLLGGSGPGVAGGSGPGVFGESGLGVFGGSGPGVFGGSGPGTSDGSELVATGAKGSEPFWEQLQAGAFASGLLLRAAPL